MPKKPPNGSIGKFLATFATLAAATNQRNPMSDIAPTPLPERECANPHCGEVGRYKRGCCSKECFQELREHVADKRAQEKQLRKQYHRELHS